MDMGPVPPADRRRWQPRKPLFARRDGWVGLWIGEAIGVSAGLFLGWLIWGRH